MTVQDVYHAFQKKARNSVVLYSIGKKIDAGTATMEDAAKYNATISTILGKVIGDNILKIPESERVKYLQWILQEQYKDTNERLAVIQKFLDKHTGIDLEPKKAPFPAERVQQLGTSLTDRTVPDETIQRRARAGSANIAASFHDDYVKENAKFRSNAGMKCYLERKVSGKCCPWCRALAGRYVYGSEPADLFRRHDNCTCQVTYESGRTRQNVWTKKTWEERPTVPDTPKPTVFSHEQAKQTEAEALRKMGLTKDTKSGIIRAGSDGMFRKAKNVKIEPMPKKQFQRIVKKFKAMGGIIQFDNETDAYLLSKNAEAITYNENTILIRQDPGRASVFEELIHTAQYRNGRNDGSYASRLRCEIEAQEKLLRNAKPYHLTAQEIRQTEKALAAYQNELEIYLKNGGV